MENKKTFNTITQIAIPTLTVVGQLGFALKLAKWGLVINLAAQPFWFYSAWKAYKKAGQIGLFITTIIVTIILILGIINYWIIG